MKKRYSCSLVAIFTLAIIALLAPQVSVGQYENVWVFGNRAGLNFNGGIPVPFVFNNVTGNLQAPIEADASVCSSVGSLLFYTEGSYVFDRQQNLMPNGSNLTGITSASSSSPTMSTAQGTIIIPFPSIPTKYYVFSLTSLEMGSNYGRLYYSVVDMTLNGGMGDVVSGQKGIFIVDSLTEQMGAVAVCGQIWLFTISRSSPELKAFKITENGINTTPVISALPLGAPTQHSMAGGSINISNNKSKMVIASGGIKGLLLFDLNTNSGTISNMQQLDTNYAYGTCFSPDDSKLYATMGSALFQFNLSLTTLPAIASSKTQLAIYSFGTEPKLAPDGKIYFAGQTPGTGINNPYLSRINAPNLSGVASNPEINAIQLASGTYARTGLPHTVPFFKEDTLHTKSSVERCGNHLGLSALDTSGTNYIWNDGFNTKTRNVLVSGKYWVRYRTNCGTRIDSFDVLLKKPAKYEFTKIICRNESYIFNGSSYNTTGLYTDTFEAANGCDSLVTLDLVIIPSKNIQLSTSQLTSLCQGDSIAMEVSGSDFYFWLINGDSIAQGSKVVAPLSLLSNEVLVVGISENNCRDTVRKNIVTQSCCDIFIPSAFSPNNDGLNDKFGAIPHGNVGEYVLYIYNRWGQRVFSSFKLNQQWDGTFNGLPADVGVYFYQLKSTCFDGTESSRKGEVMLLR